MTHWYRWVAAGVVAVSGALAQDRTQEPGAAEGKERTPVVAVPKEWTHPTIEVRGVWFARNDMEAPKEELLKKLDEIKRANFNTVLLDTWFQGYAAYAGSGYAPQYPKFRGEDVIGLLVDEAHKRGLRVDLWPSYGFYAYYTPDRAKDPSKGAMLTAHPELVAVDSEGKEFLHRSFGDYYSLCPSNPKSHELLAGFYAEQLKKYPSVEGLSLDRIRYPEDTFCFCAYCKEHFKADTGLELKAYDVKSDEGKKLLEWRREQTAKAVAAIREEAKKVKPDVVMTAYVLSPEEMNSKAQAWDLWVKRGLLDAVAVSMYGADIRPTMFKAIELLEGKKEKLMCALSAEQAESVYLTNIEVAREAGTIGQVTWFVGPVLKDVDALAKGPYAKPAESTLAK